MLKNRKKKRIYMPCIATYVRSTVKDCRLNIRGMTLDF